MTMTLLDLYLQAVALHLPRGADKADILAELAEHLRATMDERGAELGRPLTEDEQKLVLAAHGEPLVVAERYGGAHRGFAFGWQLISPQAFPAYIIALSLVIGMALLSNVALLVFGSESLLLQPRRLATTLAALFVVVTVIYIGIDAFMRHATRASSGGESAAALENMLFFSPYLKRVPIWYSATGLVFLGVVAAWWLAVPHAPALLLGASDRALELAPAWLRFYWPIAALLGVGIAQRLFSLVRPDLNWVPPVVRVVVNIAAAALVLPMLASTPYVLGADAGDLNGGLHGLLRGFGIYWFFNALWLAWLCAQHLRHRLASRRANKKRKVV
jgi:hypothetical protein